jgi:hypothetical protein
MNRDARLGRWFAVALLGLATLHLVASWGHTTVFWGDYGKWLHEVERVAHGERLYADVYWPQLPAAAWTLGAWGRVAGTDLGSMWIATILIFYAGVLGFARFMEATGPHDGGLLIGLSAAWLAWAAACIESAPLPFGGYTPASALGGTLLIWAIATAVGVVRRPSRGRAMVLGVLLGALLLTKIDFWPPVGFIALVTIMTSATAATPHAGVIPVFMMSLGATAGLGIVLLVQQSGVAVLSGVLTGFGLAGYGGARLLPRPETVVLEFTVAAGLLSLGALILWREDRNRRTRRWALGLGAAAVIGVLIWVAGYSFLSEDAAENPVAMTGLGTALDVLRRARVPFQQAAMEHVVPLAFPLLALVAAWRWRARITDPTMRRVVVLLVGTMLAARLRRGFQHVDWYHQLIELPVYSLLFGLLSRRSLDRLVRLRWTFGALGVLVAATAYWSLGRGAFTRRGWYEGVTTHRGVLHLPSPDARTYRGISILVDSIDPSGSRPLFAYGYQGGFNYFLARPNPTLLTQGFNFAALSSADREWRRVLESHPPAILLDNPYLGMSEQDGSGRTWFSWEGKPLPDIFRRYDRPLFNQLLARCREVARTPFGQLPFRVFDCSP